MPTLQQDRSYAYALQKAAQQCFKSFAFFPCDTPAKYFVVPVGKRACLEHLEEAVRESKRFTNDIRIVVIDVSGLRYISGV